MNNNKISSLFIFHRDLRLYDNSGLNLALLNSEEVLPVFIFDKKILDSLNDERKYLLIFMLNSIKHLSLDLKENNSNIYCDIGHYDEILEKISKDYNFNTVFSNFDYTPYSQKRDKSISNWCKLHNKEFIQNHDYLLNPPGEIRKADGGIYQIFTPYFKKAVQKKVTLPEQLAKDGRLFRGKSKINSMELKEIFEKYIPESFLDNKFIHQMGGRPEALELLSELNELTNYNQTHDIPSIKGTTNLSAHLKFGTISIREAYWALVEQLGFGNPIIRQLNWRDFFTQIAYFYPKVFQYAFKEKYNTLVWNTDQILFQKWCTGNTGFPIVDAGMRQLNQSGYMHNRVRMITASFLVKDMHIDWRWGEKYFAKKLIDYDPCVNNGNWQWCASTGCDAQPYFRIFNPWTQQKRFDPEALYIKKWIPELNALNAKEIHKWNEFSKKLNTKYVKPILNHKIESKRAKEIYSQVAMT